MDSPRGTIIFAPEAEEARAALKRFQRWQVDGLLEDVLAHDHPNGVPYKFVVGNYDDSIQLVVESVAPFFVILHILQGASWK
ncbi:MAG: hypothetical protein JWM95_551 [Gemmatimonadetes bacterium]|nr:hypothetical protein [Gemmatimonadota bacterium]